MKRLIYTIICFKGILAITDGGPYHKYIMLFARLLILCMCCGLIIQLTGNVRMAYKNIADNWNKITGFTISNDDINRNIETGSEYYEELIIEYYEEAGTVESEILD